ncbi:MAG: YbaB/EbfC family nucleoid-associated protein, partial [Alphaproteobacteria bacterium]|nr:YbaB/EbfC family nucleoid-associated protein [Alphaproteobacteria bacterium]
MLNIQGLMKQAQVMQKKMQEAQEKLAQTEVTGTSANG